MKIVLLALLLFIYPALSAQSPWTQKQGKVYTQLSFNYIPNYSSLFNKNGDVIPTERKITDNTLQFYGEYGLTSKGTIVTVLPFKLLAAKELVSGTNMIVNTESERFNSLGNIEIGYRYKIREGKYVFSGQLSLELPTSSYHDNSGLRTGYDAWSVNPTLSLGRGFESMYFYIYSGFQIKSSEYDDYIHLGGELGTHVSDAFIISFYLDILNSLENGNRTEPINNSLTGLYVNGQEYSAFGLKGIYEFKEKYGIVALFGGAFYGHLVAYKLASNISIYAKF